MWDSAFPFFRLPSSLPSATVPFLLPSIFQSVSLSLSLSKTLLLVFLPEKLIEIRERSVFLSLFLFGFDRIYCSSSSDQHLIAAATMNDLLTDSFEIPRGQASRDGDIELGMQAPTNAGELGLENFFKQVQEIEKQIDKLSKLQKKLQDAHEESKSITKASAMKAIKQRMEKDVDESGKIALIAKSKLEALDKDNLASRQKPGCGKGSGVDRSRTATTVALKKKLKERLGEFQTLREAIQEEYREVIERRVFTVTGARADEETIDRLVETGDGEQIFKKAIQEQGRGQIMDTLAEIHERHDAVKDLEKKLLDLQQIFLDMSVLVEAQGDMLDNIEAHVATAVNHVQSGTATLQKAKKLQKSSRKWMCIAIIILLIIVAVIVVGVLKPWSKSS